MFLLASTLQARAAQADKLYFTSFLASFADLAVTSI